MRVEDLQNEVVRLTRAWYEYVTMDHHKDRDCHWYIQADFAYGDPPTFVAYHDGYVADTPRSVKAETYEAALHGLLFLVRRTIREEQEWAKGALAEREEYDLGQVAGAEYILKVEL